MAYIFFHWFLSSLFQCQDNSFQTFKSNIIHWTSAAVMLLPHQKAIISTVVLMTQLLFFTTTTTTTTTDIVSVCQLCTKKTQRPNDNNAVKCQIRNALNSKVCPLPNNTNSHCATIATLCSCYLPAHHCLSSEPLFKCMPTGI